MGKEKNDIAWIIIGAGKLLLVILGAAIWWVCAISIFKFVFG